jgi:hypothetical protein
MPAVSAKQYAFMQAHAHGKGLGGPSPEVAREFIAKTPEAKRKKFAKALARKRKRDA